ncbi:MAG: SAM-dependent chlorinase/fluorinase [Firmicutes bacterium]|nr:SAM-dependent chlorinase/fluorinase [Bacillota bacterium]
MMKPLIVHMDCGPASTEWAKVAGLCQKTCPGLDVSQGTLLMQDSLTISAYLYTTLPYWPDESVFLSLVKKGFNQAATTSAFSSLPVAIRLPNGSIILSPNNGTATVCASLMSEGDLSRLSAYFVDPSRFGGDDYALVRCGASLAGGLPLEEVGPKASLREVFFYSLPKASIQPGIAEGQVFMLLKTFGNLTFTISIDEFEQTGIKSGDPVHVTFTRDGKIEWESDTSFQPSFGYVPEGEPVVFNGSSGYMDIGLNRKSFIDECLPQILTLEDPTQFKVRIEKI